MTRILIIDDESGVRSEIAAELVASGYDVEEAGNGAEGLALIVQNPPDLILCDVAMPEMDGRQLLTALREHHPELADIPFVFLSALGAKDDILEGLRIGADDYLIKPIDFESLQAKIKSTLRLRVVYEAQLKYQENFDPLTGLPNTALAIDRLAQLMSDHYGKKRFLSALCVGLDKFHIVNDSLGRHAGDAILKQVAGRLDSAINRLSFTSSVSHLEGNDFLVVVSASEEFGLSEISIQRIFDVFSEPFEWKGEPIRIDASVGIATWPGRLRDPYEILNAASMAKSEAKTTEGNSYRFFLPKMNEAAAQQLKLESHLAGVLDKEELYLDYQPLIDVNGGGIVGAEALLRWHNPDLGIVPPDHFIPLLEKSREIIPVGDWILKAALKAAHSWHAVYTAPLRVAVNFSANQFEDPELALRIRDMAAAAGVSFENLEIEITERLLMRDSPVAVATLDELCDQGVRLSIDDFGTGFSSLSLLRRYPFKTVKIDRSFVMNAPHDAKDSALVEAIIAMAHGIGLEVIAEGVETVEQFEFLRSAGCDVVQGYLFGKPISPNNFSNLLCRTYGRLGAGQP